MLRPVQLGLAFRFLRTSRQLKQHQVAERAGITPSMLSGYENGRKLPTLATLEKILLAMDCSLRDLVDALDLVLDGGKAKRAGHRLLGPAEAGGERSPPRLNALAPPGVPDLALVFGAEPLAREEEQAFGEMLSGYCRWLRYLRQQTTAPWD